MFMTGLQNRHLAGRPQCLWQACELGTSRGDATVRAGRPQCLWQAQILAPAAVRACVSPGPPGRDAKLFLHTANQRPRVLICLQPIHRGWFNPRYILVRPRLLLSTARSAVGKATCSTALHCLFSGCEFKSSCWLFFGYNKMGNNGVYSVRGDTQMRK